MTIPLPNHRQLSCFSPSHGESKCTEDRLDSRRGFAHAGIARRSLPCCCLEELGCLHRMRKPVHHLVSRLFVLAEWQLCCSHQVQLAFGCCDAAYHLGMWGRQRGRPFHLCQPLSDALVLDESRQVNAPHLLDVVLGLDQGFSTEYRSA